jgi:hypothetical protein
MYARMCLYVCMHVCIYCGIFAQGTECEVGRNSRY